MKFTPQNIFIAIFMIVLIITLVIALQKGMTHRMFIYHHSDVDAEKATKDQTLPLVNNMNLPEPNATIEYQKASQYNTLPPEDAFVRCHVPTLNTQQCWQSRFFECPVINGSYQQCTNNYLPKSNGRTGLPRETAPCETGRAGFEMAPPTLKISEDCYYNTVKTFAT